MLAACVRRPTLGLQQTSSSCRARARTTFRHTHGFGNALVPRLAATTRSARSHCVSAVRVAKSEVQPRILRCTGEYLGTRLLLAGAASWTASALVLNSHAVAKCEDACAVTAVGSETLQTSPKAAGVSVKPAMKREGLLTRALHLCAGICSMGFLMSVWAVAITMPIALVVAVTTSSWWLAGGLTTAFALPHALPLPRLPFTQDFLLFGLKSWLGGTVNFVDLSSEIGSEPEPEPAPAVSANAKPRLYCYHPHGIFSMGMVTLMEHIPNMKVLSSPFLYNCAPVFRVAVESFLGFKMGSVGRGDLTALMKRRESPVVLVPGGFHEATISCPGRERVFLKNRRGFVKYALRYGYDLVPCYTFGENDLMANPQGGWAWRFALNALSLPAVLPWGHWLFPLFPRRGLDVTTAVGPPVKMPHIPKPTSADVEEHHARYIEALKRLYARAVPGTGSAGRPLEVW